MSLGPEAMLQLVTQHHESAEEGHTRLRQDLRELEVRVDTLEAARSAMDLHINRVDMAANRPLEVSALRFTPAMLITAIALCLSIVSSAWWATAGIRSDVREIGNKLDARQKLDDERTSAINDKINSIQRMQQLNQYDIQTIKEAIAKKGLLR